MEVRDLADWLKAWMTKHPELTQNEIGRRLGHTSNSAVSYILRRESNVSIKALDDWVKALRIRDAKDVAHFRLLVQLSHATQEIRDHFWRNQDRLDTLEKIVNQMPAGMAALIERVETLEAELSETRTRKLKRGN